MFERRNGGKEGRGHTGRSEEKKEDKGGGKKVRNGCERRGN